MTSNFEEPSIDLMGKEYGLSYRQEWFCLYYFRYRNATLAYKMAYSCSDRVANINGPRQLKKLKILAFIERYRCLVCIRAGLNVQKSMDWLIWLDSHYANNPYHWKKKNQPF